MFSNYVIQKYVQSFAKMRMSNTYVDNSKTGKFVNAIRESQKGEFPLILKMTNLMTRRKQSRNM